MRSKTIISANLPISIDPDTSSIKLTYAPLDIRFRVDEDMSNYLEIYNWMTGLGTPEDIKQYKSLNETGNRTTSGTGKMGNVM